MPRRSKGVPTPFELLLSQSQQAVELLLHTLGTLDDQAIRPALATAEPTKVYDACMLIVLRYLMMQFASQRGLITVGETQVDEAPSANNTNKVVASKHSWREFRQLINLLAADANIEQDDEFRALPPIWQSSLFHNELNPVLHAISALPAGSNNGSKQLDQTASQICELLRQPLGQLQAPPFNYVEFELEQLGELYQHLLSHTATRVQESHIAMHAKDRRTKYIPISELASNQAKGNEQLLAFLKAQTGWSHAELLRKLARNFSPADVTATESESLDRNQTDSETQSIEYAKLLDALDPLIVRDPLNRRWIVPAGGFVMRTSRGRKSAGTHYTPRALSKPLVAHALAPLLGSPDDSADWPSDQSRQLEKHRARLLSLRICDPACGGGAFLLEAARLLASTVAPLADAETSINQPDHTLTQADDLQSSDRQQLIDQQVPLNVRRLVKACLYGVDKDLRAVELTKIALWMWIGDRDLSIHEFDSQIVCGDALADEQASTTTLHPTSADRPFANQVPIPFSWSNAFSDILAAGGFDAMIGNPPFVNAIEGMVDRTRKRQLANWTRWLIGTADYSFYFLELAHRLTKPAGTIGFLLPRNILTARAAEQLRRELLQDRPPSLIVSPNNARLFSSANVFVVALVLGRSDQCQVGTTLADLTLDRHHNDQSAEQSQHNQEHTKSATLLKQPDRPAVRTVKITSTNWWEPIVQPTDPDVTASTPHGVIGDTFEVFASMTTGMAYQLVPYVKEADETARAEESLGRLDRSCFKLINTGLIEPGECQWGVTTCRYLKSRYDRPVITITPDMPTELLARLEKIRRPKILVAGLSNRVEAIIDPVGDLVGAVSTFTILHPQDNLNVLTHLCHYLNEPFASQRLQAELGANAMSGGRITLSKLFLAKLPYDIPKPTST